MWLTKPFAMASVTLSGARACALCTAVNWTVCVLARIGRTRVNDLFLGPATPSYFTKQQTQTQLLTGRAIELRLLFVIYVLIIVYARNSDSNGTMLLLLVNFCRTSARRVLFSSLQLNKQIVRIITSWNQDNWYPESIKGMKCNEPNFYLFIFH